MVDELLDRMADAGGGVLDFVADFAYPIPALVGRDDNVLLIIGAANRDPGRFPDPDAFDPTRPGPPSLAFGVGLHYCLGAAVSRLKGRLALPRLFARFPRLAVTETPTYSGSLFLRGIDKLLVSTGG